jgi:glycosyltransferase involved in cell wall biosynthesis
MNLEQLYKEKSKNKTDLVSILLPLYNEQDSIIFVLEELFNFIENYDKKYRFEITFIDDCSTDNSINSILYKSKDSPINCKVSVVKLSKNSGSHVAITAGLNISRGNLVIIMASDGQDPANLIGQFILFWENGAKLILASRKSNLDQSFISNYFSKKAWKIMNWSTQLNMPKGGCDVLALDRNVVNSFNRMDERNTTFIFRILALGYKYEEFSYVKRERIAGKSKWTFLKKIAIMFDAITGFSNRPLKLITKFGLTIFILLILRWLYIIFNIYILRENANELTIILNTILTSTSVIILLLGGIGDYIWRILDETRKRPLYEVDSVVGEIFEENGDK